MDNVTRHLRHLQETDAEAVIEVGRDCSDATSNETLTLLITVEIYMSVFVVVWLLFSFLRLQYPKYYNVRSWSPLIKNKLANDQHGVFGWLFRLFAIHEDEYLEYCNIDNLCFVRILHILFKISMMGIFNMLWLVPLYITSDNGKCNYFIELKDYIKAATVDSIPDGSDKLLGTVVACYILFFYSMYLILEEFKWFTIIRYKFLSKRKPRNYTVYVSNVPEQFASKYILHNYFNKCISGGSTSSSTARKKQEVLVETNMKYSTPQLTKIINERDKILWKLQHCINIKESTNGETIPTHINKNKDEVYSIETYTQELKKLNLQVKQAVQLIQYKEKQILSKAQQRAAGREEEEEEDEEYEDREVSTNPLLVNSQNKKDKNNNLDKDGQPFHAAFITFRTLKDTHQALQMNHYKEPFSMQMVQAPESEDVLWKNIGMSNMKMQVGKLVSTIGTVALCLFWTIPMAFFATLSSVSGLKAQFPWLENILEKQPWLELVIEQLAPLLLVVVNSLLPAILKALSNLEGPISGSLLETLLYSKLSIFMIIQTFFISALGGGILAQLNDLILDPWAIVPLLARELPKKSTYFIQILFVMTVLGLGLELLGVSRIAIAAIRNCIGPNLTRKERNTIYWGLNPLSIPPTFQQAKTWANIVLFMMVLFVYSAIAPITSFFLAFSFLLMGSGYRHQFIYLYDSTLPDSGGLIWLRFVNFMLAAMVISQITVAGLLGLKKSVVYGPLMFPLIAITILFIRYIKQEHFAKPIYLPTNICYKYDQKNLDELTTENNGLFFINNLYVQPELKTGTRPLLPDDLTADLMMELTEFENYIDDDHVGDSSKNYLKGRKRGKEEGYVNDDKYSDEDDTSLSSNEPLQVPCECTLHDLSVGATKKLKVKIEDKENIYTVDIQPGWTDGTRINFKAIDEIGFPPVSFVIDELKHETFQRRGDDLYMKVAISQLVYEDDEDGDHNNFFKLKMTLPNGETWKTIIRRNSPILKYGNSITIPNKGMPINNGSSATNDRGNILVEFEKTADMAEI